MLRSGVIAARAPLSSILLWAEDPNQKGLGACTGGNLAGVVSAARVDHQHLIGKQVRLPLTGRLVPVIADEYVDKTFGTGVVKVTPAHDVNDYAVGQRHGLPMICILNLDASINAEAPDTHNLIERRLTFPVRTVGWFTMAA